MLALASPLTLAYAGAAPVVQRASTVTMQSKEEVRRRRFDRARCGCSARPGLHTAIFCLSPV